MPKLNARWTDDCQGKKDYDASIVEVSTRYWPRGGGFSLVRTSSCGVEIQDSAEVFPHLRPSAVSSIIIRARDEDYPNYNYSKYIRLIEAKFEDDTEEAVKAAVEVWAQAQMDRIVLALQQEFQSDVPNAGLDSDD